MEWNKNYQSSSIYVYNFPNDWIENDFKTHFMMFGTINNIMIDKDINLCAQIQYDDIESVQNAIEVMNGKEIGGKIINVSPRKIVEKCQDIIYNKTEAQQKTQ
ncbi:RNA-binding protein, putative, partial [Hepatocystis sp. ex Piliocolobus tephrosceles]